MTRQEEQSLVTRAQADPQHFEAIYRAYTGEIYRFIFYKTSSIQVAEDLTAQVFMRALEHLGSFQYQAGTRFSSWLYQIARHAVIDYYRTNRPTVELTEAETITNIDSAVHQVDQQLDQARVQQVLQQLSPDDQTVLQLRLWEHKPYTDIATIMQLSNVTVRARYVRALKKFKRCYLASYETH